MTNDVTLKAGCCGGWPTRSHPSIVIHSSVIFSRVTTVRQGKHARPQGAPGCATGGRKTLLIYYKNKMANHTTAEMSKLLLLFVFSARHLFCFTGVLHLLTRNSPGDEIANVNFLYDDIVHALKNTIHSCINSATHRFLQRKFTKFSEITQCNGHYAVQGHSRSPILVPVESSYTTSY